MDDVRGRLHAFSVRLLAARDGDCECEYNATIDRRDRGHACPLRIN